MKSTAPSVSAARGEKSPQVADGRGHQIQRTASCVRLPLFGNRRCPARRGAAGPVLQAEGGGDVQPGRPPRRASNSSREGASPPGGRRGAAAWAPVPGPGGRSTGPPAAPACGPGRSSRPTAAARLLPCRYPPGCSQSRTGQPGGPQSPAACRTRRDSRGVATTKSKPPAGSRPRIFRRSPRRKIRRSARPFGRRPAPPSGRRPAAAPHR